MIKFILKTSRLSVLALAVAALPVCVGAKDTNAPALDQNEAKTKKPPVLPFRGKLKAVDNTARTIAVGQRAFLITSETKISKADKPATLEDGVVGENVSGAYKKSEDGKLTATSIHFGPKPEKTKVKKEKMKAE